MRDQYREGLQVLATIPQPPAGETVKRQISSPASSANNSVFIVSFPDSAGRPGDKHYLIKKVYSRDDTAMRECGVLFNGFANSLRFTTNSQFTETIMPIVAADITTDGEFVLYFTPAPLGDLTLNRPTLAPSHDDAAYEKKSLETMLKITEPLVTSHSQGVMHADIKPSNIVVYEQKARLIDFDIARRPASQRKLSNEKIAGTFLPPEALYVEYQPNFTTDVFAMGYVFYEYLTGDDVGKGFHKAGLDLIRDSLPGITPETDPLKDLPTIAMNPEKLGSLPTSIQDIILKATALKPQDRYQNAGELQRAIHAALKRKADPIETQEIILEEVGLDESVEVVVVD